MQKKSFKHKVRSQQSSQFGMLSVSVLNSFSNQILRANYRFYNQTSAHLVHPFLNKLFSKSLFFEIKFNSVDPSVFHPLRFLFVCMTSTYCDWPVVNLVSSGSAPTWRSRWTLRPNPAISAWPAKRTWGPGSAATANSTGGEAPQDCSSRRGGALSGSALGLSPGASIREGLQNISLAQPESIRSDL